MKKKNKKPKQRIVKQTKPNIETNFSNHFLSLDHIHDVSQPCFDLNKSWPFLMVFLNGIRIKVIFNLVYLHI